MRLVLTFLLSAFSFSFIHANDKKGSPLFSEGNPSYEMRRECENKIKVIHWLRLNEDELQNISKHKPKTLSLNIPLVGGKILQLELQSSSVESPAFQIRASGGNSYSKVWQKPLQFRGTVVGEKSSLAAISISSTEISGIISFGEGNYNLVKLKDGSRNLYALFNDRGIREENPFRCHSDEVQERIQHSAKKLLQNQSSPQSGNCRRVDIFFECDYKMFQDNGGTVAGTVNYLESMFNVVAGIYAQEGINIRISEVFVHSQPDNYPYATSFEALYAFGDSMNVRPLTGNLGHLLSTRPQANGGVAYLDVLCSQGLGYSNIYNSFLPLPFYSWTINVVAHELGHNFGSPHTQSCSWEISPGNYGMLDSCFFAEEGCYTGPRIASAGTVMSYCHLMNLGVDLSKGFGPKPGNLIRERYQSAGCLAGAVDFPQLSISPSDSICSGSTLELSVTEVDGASYAWTGPNGFTGNQAAVSIPGAGPLQSGAYSVTISKDGCDALPLKTRVDVNCIYAIPLTNRIACVESGFQVNYTSSVSLGPGNVFTVQMSNAAGNFGSPLSIGSLASSQLRGSIPVQLPVGIAPDSGYVLRIVSSNPANTGNASIQKLKILARPNGPQTTGASRCGPGFLQLSASSADSLFWYESPEGGVPLGSGSVIQVGNLSSSKSYWAESRKIRRNRIGPVVDFNAGDTLNVINTYHGLFIRVKKSLRIDSVVVHPSGPGTVHFNIKDSANTFFYRKVTAAVSGNLSGEKVPVGLELSPGLYRVDGEGSTVPGMLRLNNFLSYPIESEGVDFIGSSVPSRYYFFFDWRISLLECPSARKEVRAEIFSQPSPPVISLSQNYVVSSADTLQRWYRNGSFLGVFGDSLDALIFGNGVYKSILLTSDSCQAESNSLSVFFTGVEDSEMTFLPNPGQGTFHLNFTGNNRRQLICLDATGRQVWASSTEIAHNKLDFRFLPDGIYALLILSDGKSHVLRFRKEQ